MKKIATIVVTFNRKKLLLECLKALLNQKEAATDIVLVDNNSTDGTFEYISEVLDNQKIHYYNTNENIGGAGGFNFGLKKAVELGYDYFWLMDDDSIPDENALYEILKADKVLQGEYGFICCNVHWIDGLPCKMNIPEISKNWLNNVKYISNLLIPVSKATFVGFFFKKKILYDVGLPIKDFFIWSDDANFSLRIVKKYDAYIAINSCIIHKMKSNVGASIIMDDSGRNQRYFYAYRNRYYNSKMENKVKSYWLDIFKTTILILSRSKNKISKLYYMYKGVFAGINFNPSIEYIK